MQPAIQRAVEAARASTQLNIPVSFASVADAPYDFEDRLSPVTGLGLTRLTVVVPERHDLALMKLIRGYQHDVEVIEQIHQRQPLSLDVLRSRFTGEMGHVLRPFTLTPDGASYRISGALDLSAVLGSGVSEKSSSGGVI